VLGSSLLVVIALARAGIMLFWQGEPSTSASGGRNARAPAAGALLAASPLLVLLAGPIADYTQRLASQLLDGEAYIATIRGLEPEDPPADMNEKPSKGRPGGVTEGGPP
jgi:multicomponent K+:H+ antiporter subunit D